MSQSSSTPQVIQPILELFSVNTSAFWATTYNIDLTLFSEFLLSRLGDPPLNVVVLSDQTRLDSSLKRIPRDNVDTLSSVNKKWLLRGILPGTGSFHPKSYLSVTGKRVKLLVGSGNLSSNGINEGHEVFTVFHSGTLVGDAAISIWVDWMYRLIELVGDTTLAGRFQHLKNLLPSLPTTAVFKPLLFNLETPITDQFISIIKSESTNEIDELLVTAPFFDGQAIALSRLLNDLHPNRVKIFLNNTTSVNGECLREVLEKSRATIEVIGYKPDVFVHAKLIGVIATGKTWLLSGSANLSQAALTQIPSHGGNIELAVLSRPEVNTITDFFIPPGLTVSVQNIDYLNILKHADIEDDDGVSSIHLVCAILLTDGRIEIRVASPAQSDWFLDDLFDQMQLLVKSESILVTSGPLTGRLVRIINEDKDTISNQVIVDDSNALESILTDKPEHSRNELPPELTSGDLDTPLGKALVWLNQNLIMDVSERLTKIPQNGLNIEEVGNQEDDDLWQRLEKEQLSRDPRSTTYSRILVRNLTESSPIFDIIDILRNRAPDVSPRKSGKSLIQQLLNYEKKSEDQINIPAHRWAMSTRIRVRAKNVLKRWANAQTDERLVWIDPLAPISNLVMIMTVLTELHLENAYDDMEVELSIDDLNELWLQWLKPIVGSDKSKGWLDRLDPDDLELAAQRIPSWIPEISAALCWLATGTGSERSTIIEWQPVIAAALKHNFLEPTELSADFLTIVFGKSITYPKVEEHLLKVIDFIDDKLWSEKTRGELGIKELEITLPPSGAPRLGFQLNVSNIQNPLWDPLVPRLIVSACNYRKKDGLAIYSSDFTWRIVISVGKSIIYRPDQAEHTIESLIIVEKGMFEHLVSTGGVLASFFQDIEIA